MARTLGDFLREIEPEQVSPWPPESRQYRSFFRMEKPVTVRARCGNGHSWIGVLFHHFTGFKGTLKWSLGMPDRRIAPYDRCPECGGKWTGAAGVHIV